MLVHNERLGEKNSPTNLAVYQFTVQDKRSKEQELTFLDSL